MMILAQTEKQVRGGSGALPPAWPRSARNQPANTRSVLTTSPSPGGLPGCASQPFSRPGAAPPPRESPRAAPRAAGCSWRLPPECQTAFFCGRQRRTSSQSLSQAVRVGTVSAAATPAAKTRWRPPLKEMLGPSLSVLSWSSFSSRHSLHPSAGPLHTGWRAWVRTWLLHSSLRLLLHLKALLAAVLRSCLGSGSQSLLLVKGGHHSSSSSLSPLSLLVCCGAKSSKRVSGLHDRRGL